MKAFLGKNLKISLPKAYQNKEKSKTLFVKGVPTEFSNDEFKQVFDHNKIKDAKAERMKSKRDGRMLQMFQIELSDPAEAEAIISSKITCPQTGIIFKVEEFRAPISVQQCYNCQNFGHSAKTVRQKLSVLSVEKANLTKDAQTEKNSNPHVLTVKDHMLQTIKGVQLIKNRCSINMWWTTKKAMPRL